MLDLLLNLSNYFFILLIKIIHLLLVLNIVEHLLVGLILEGLSVLTDNLEPHLGSHRFHRKQILSLFIQPLSLPCDFLKTGLLLLEKLIHDVLFPMTVVVFVSDHI